MADWNDSVLSSESEVLEVLLELKGKNWMCRGQSRNRKRLIPSIDREPLAHLIRAQKLSLERRAIDMWRSSARYFANQGEELAREDDITTLMVLRHYGLPTRLLDWSMSPWVATYFAVSEHDKEDAEIWAFDRLRYQSKGKAQWIRWPETTTDGSGDPDQFDAKLTAFGLAEPPDWFVCGFYQPAFPRQHAQDGAYSLTARFERDHAEAIADLLEDLSAHHHYTVKADLKAKLRTMLREHHGLWRGPLYPDAAGAAETVRKAIFGDDG